MSRFDSSRSCRWDTGAYEQFVVDASSCCPSVGAEHSKSPRRVTDLYREYAVSRSHERSFKQKCRASTNGLERMVLAVKAVESRLKAEAIGRYIVTNLSTITHVGGQQESLLQSCWQASQCKDEAMRHALLRLKHPSMRATRQMHQQASSRCHGTLFATIMPSIQEDEAKRELSLKPSSC